MNLIEKLDNKEKDQISFSFEVTPPLRGLDIGGVSKTIETLLPFYPLWIDITSHAPDVDWVKAATPALFEKKIQKKRPGTISVCAALQFKYGIDCVPHLLCRGFSVEETEDSLIDLHYLGIRNILAIRGDGDIHVENPKNPGFESHLYATDLLQQISNLREGIYLHQKAEPMKFCTGIGFYPEKHFESPNQSFGLQILQKKSLLGA
ncbi:MAG: methylenetetrahydrofolate reductase, partial [Deltaproteobacteria bacterium]|nr:methylenetetrahydrofolate reductase [Deltaproteobacteria bacterium]